MKKRFTASTDRAGVKTEYSYDEKLRQTGVEKEGNRVAYGYDGQDRLTSITHNGFSYGFLYDSWGNDAGLAIAGTTVQANTYAAGNGKLLRTDFANGFYTEPVYDEKELAVGEKWNGVLAVEQAYNNAGEFVRRTDHMTGREYRYDYDFNSRPIRQYVYDTQSGEKLYEFQNIYDGAGRLAAVHYGMDGVFYDYRHSYAADDLPTKTVLPNGGTAAYFVEGTPVCL